ncbi:MAG: flagellar hook capping FlgD N-terminal domain-containing protein [Rhodospirillales bacterium]
MFLDATTSATTTTASTSKSTSQAATDGAKLNENLNQFLTLLITQLQHQDPLQPMDANEFTQQLVQFASVEQQIYQNANLEKMLAVQESAQSSNLINYIGSAVETEGNELSLNGTSGATAHYTLPEQATETSIVVRDEKGNAVFSTRGQTTAGSHTFTWDGLDDDGDALPAGTYSLLVNAVRKDGTSLDVGTSVINTVTGVANDGSTPELILGSRRVSLADILSVNAP